MVRLFLAIFVGKLIFYLTRFLKIGGGSAAPGLYALKIYPGLTSQLCRQIPQNIVITGTNGKTTTARILDHLVKSQNTKTLRNSTGSNLERGVASALLQKCNILGKIDNVDLGIWELDEAAFNKVVFSIKPQIMVFLNAFRDQLDRYGEVDAVVGNWWETLSKVDWSPTLVINNGDINTSSISGVNDGGDKDFNIMGFRVKNHVLWREGSLIINEKDRFDWDVVVAEIIVNKGLSGTEFKVTNGNESFKISLPLPGVYHVYDFLAAYCTYFLLNLPTDKLGENIAHFNPAFGRVEKIKLGEKDGFIFLVKNPAGANSVLETLIPEFLGDDAILIALNDNFADGTDVSWIWDADFEPLFGNRSIRQEIDSNSKSQGPQKTVKLLPGFPGKKIVICGTRAYDMALRLKYAGCRVEDLVVLPDLESGFEEAKKDLKGRLFLLPTYTALLDLQKLLAGKGIKKHYWRTNEE